jgi:hypothetical protein
MKKHLAALALIPAFAVCLPAHASCKQKTEAPVQLENIVVTPDRSYTATEWAQHQASKSVAAVTLPTMIVTPDYQITDEERRQHAREKAQASANVMQASVSPGTNHQGALLRFMRRLFN